MKIYKSNGLINSLFPLSIYLSLSHSLTYTFVRSVYWRKMFWHFELFQFRMISIKYFAMRILLMFNVWSMDSLTIRSLYNMYTVSIIIIFVVLTELHSHFGSTLACSRCDYVILCYCEKEAGPGNASCVRDRVIWRKIT